MTENAYAKGRLIPSTETRRPIPVVDTTFGTIERPLIDVVALIDTGSEASILHPSLAQAFPDVRSIVTHGVGSTSSSRVVMGSIRVGTLDYTGEFLVADFNNETHGAIIGMDILQHVTLVMDATRGKLTILKP